MRCHANVRLIGATASPGFPLRDWAGAFGGRIRPSPPLAREGSGYPGNARLPRAIRPVSRLHVEILGAGELNERRREEGGNYGEGSARLERVEPRSNDPPGLTASAQKATHIKHGGFLMRHRNPVNRAAP